MKPVPDQPLARSVITALEPQVRRPERVNVFVDGHFAVGVHAEVAVAEGLRVGQVLDVARLERIAVREERRRARESALKLLGYRARSRDELRQRLERKGYEPPLVAEVLESLARNGFLDDTEFSQAWVANRTGSRAMGPSRLAAELRQKGVAKETIEAALAPLDEDTQLQMALDIARQKAGRMGGEEPRAARRKLTGMLMRRGFGWSTAAKAVALALGEGEEEEFTTD